MVDVSGIFLLCAGIKCSAPQGSILGPILFLIYVYDMSGAINNKLLLYADDSVILVADKQLSKFETIIENEFDTVSDWLIDNQLSLHLSKTESMLFCSKQRLQPTSNLNIECKGNVIEPKENVKYVGAVFGTKSDW